MLFLIDGSRDIAVQRRYIPKEMSNILYAYFNDQTKILGVLSLRGWKIYHIFISRLSDLLTLNTSVHDVVNVRKLIEGGSKCSVCPPPPPSTSVPAH